MKSTNSKVRNNRSAANQPIEMDLLKNGNESIDALTVSDTVKQIHSWFRSSRKARVKWRNEATQWYKFYNGDQYSDEDKRQYGDLDRPMPVFNRVAPIVRTVVGLAHDDNQSVVYKAVKPTPYGSRPASIQQSAPIQQTAPIQRPASIQQPALIQQQASTQGLFTPSELIQSACGYFERKCSAVDEDLEVFRDLVICGEGWSESFISINNAGMVDPKRVRVNPFEIFPDPRASRKNNTDARYIIRARNYSVTDLIALYPAKKKEIQAAGGLSRTLDEAISLSYDIGNTSNEVARSGYFEADRLIFDNSDRMTVLECQWYDYESVLFVTLPDKTTKVMTDTEYELFLGELSKSDVKLDAEPMQMRQKVYKRAFVVGNIELSSRKSPLPDEFTYKCMTGERDQNDGYYYGIVRDLVDPQRYSNIFMGTILHVINTNAKGGIMAETTAFDDVSDAENSYAAADSIVWLSEGGTNKVTPKPSTPMPQALPDMLSFSVASMPQISGVSLDIMGLNPNAQAMGLEEQRRKANKKLLAPFFSSLARYRHDCGVALWKLIKSYVDPSRVITIGDLNDSVSIDLSILDEDMEVNVEVTEGYDNNKNVEAMWDSLSKILPGMMQSGIPIPPSIVQLIPAPDKLRKEWADLIAKSSEPKQPTEIEQSLARESEANTKETESKVQLNIAKADNLLLDAAIKKKDLLTGNTNKGV